MAKIGEYEVPDDLYYHKEHVWAKVDVDSVRVGLTDFNQKLAGELSFIEMPEEDMEVEAGEVVGTFETGKWMGKIYAPVSGTITAINEDIEDDPSEVNSDPYGNGWIFEIKMKDKSELDDLMLGPASHDWLRSEIAKHADT